MPDLRELYQEVILDHSKTPRNYREMGSASRRAEGYNPLCGDRFVVFVDLKDGVLRDVSFQGSGCAISKASASMMTETLKGRTEAESDAIFNRFHDLVTGHLGTTPTNEGPAIAETQAGALGASEGSNGGPRKLGKLAVFSGVSEFPVRVKCATLAWHTLRAALHQSAERVSTE